MSEARPPTVSYLICTSPRSGSSLLGDGLASTLLAGNPREWFNPLEEQRELARWSFDRSVAPSYANYLAHVLKWSTTPNGVCGVKLHYYQLRALVDNLGSIDRYRGLAGDALLSAAFPGVRYIWLTRRDKARQAISYHRACQTNEWWLLDDARAGRRGSQRGTATFEPETIVALEHSLTDSDRGWQRFFAEASIEPHVVEYEELAADYGGTIAAVLDWLGVSAAGAVAVRPARVRQQADALSEEWLTAYLEFKATVRHSPPATSTRPDALWPMAPPASETLPPAWRHWLAYHLLRDAPEAVLIETLVEEGYRRDQAAREIAHATADPYLLAARHRQQMLNKAEHLLAALDTVSSLQPPVDVVVRRTGLSHTQFCEQHYAANRPVILEQHMDAWPALTRWTPAYLKRAAGHEAVEVMANHEGGPDSQRDNAQHVTLMGFADYVDMVDSGTIVNNGCMVASNGLLRRPGGSTLLADVTPFTEYLEPDATGENTLFWCAPAGAVTPLHHDACNTMLCQVTGTRRFKLIPANQWALVYHDEGFFSDIDCEAPDLERRPAFRDATVLDVMLEPGEVLFVPVGWSFQATSLNVNTVITFTGFKLPNRYVW